LLVVAARGRANLFYTQMVASFALLALLLPSASTRGAILLPVYEQALDRLLVPAGAPLRAAIMLGLASLNRLGSNALLTGGITPVVAAGLIGGFSWTSWLVFMGVPVYLLLLLGGVAVYLLTRPARTRLPPTELKPAATPLTAAEGRTLLIAAAVSALWMTDALHHWDPALPALLGAVALLTPGLGVLRWSDLERSLGWVNLLVIAASLSLAQAMTASGAAAWLANLLRLGLSPLIGSPLALAATLVCACLLLRLVLPNIAAYLSLLIPVVMELAPDVGLNPLVGAMLVTVAGDSVLYYPAQSASSLMVAERGHLRAGAVFGLGAVMSLLVLAVLLLLAIPWWSWLGEPLAAA
jgi:di/tricarboxylate transporter